MSDVLDSLAESADMAFARWSGRNGRGLFLFIVGVAGGLVCGRGGPALTSLTGMSSLFIINLTIFCNHFCFCRFNAMSVHIPPCFPWAHPICTVPP